MRFFLALLLPFHWMVAFALLAALAASGPHGMEEVASILGMTTAMDALPDFGAATAAFFAVIFALVAVLFLWSLLTVAIGQQELPGPADEISSAAFGAAISATTALLLIAAVTPVTGLFTVVALQVAALAASFAAVHAERRAASLVVVRQGDDARAAARLMAAGAAHSSMLTRLSGRGPEAGN